MTKEYTWLNEKSRKFLEKDYLVPGLTPEQRIKDICLAAEKILNIEGFADKLESYVAKGWVSFSSPIWANFGNKRGAPISCVSEDSWIITENGGKMAKEVAIGDKLLTHRGRFRSVSKIIPTRDRGDIYTLKVCNRMTPIKITGDHLILTNLGWVRADNLDINKHLVAINGDIEIQESEYCIDLTPYCDYKHEISDGKIKRRNTKKTTKRTGNIFCDYFSKPNVKVCFDKDLAWAFGLWFAEGSLSTNKQKPNGIRITLGCDEKPEAEKWLKIVSEKFGINGNIYESKYIRHGKENKWINVNVNSNIIGNFFQSFGNGCKEKLIPDWILNLPVEQLSSFLDGILFGDGSVHKNDGCRITLANPKLLLQIYLIGLKLGKEMSLQMQSKAGKLATTKFVYTISFKNHTLSRNRNTFNSGIRFTDGLIYSPIRVIEKTDKTENVYDFTVEEDHSFSVAGIVVHNCFGSYIEDTMDSILYKVAEVGTMTKIGGGTSAYFGKLRGRGTPISVGGTSSGPVHFMELFETTTNVVSQSNIRRGSFAAYLDIDHPDIEEFLQIRSEGHTIQHISLGVCVSDAWMESMIEGDKKKRDIWAKVIKKRFESGYPYIFFIDTVNRNAPQVYKDTGKKIHSSNLCVTGDTLIDILVDDNLKLKIRIEDLYFYRQKYKNIKVKSYDLNTKSEVYSEITDFAQTGESKEIIEIEDENGNVLKCTPDHKIYTKNRGYVEAKDLKEDDVLEIQQ